MTEANIVIENKEGIDFLNTLDDKSVDLILTDPPYIISRESGMNSHYDYVKKIEHTNINKKTIDDWKDFYRENKARIEKRISESSDTLPIIKQNYIKYGSMCGKKYAVKTDYGDWDKKFTMEILEKFIQLFYKKLRKGGTCIIFFDIWKITILKELLEKYKFKQIRFIEWIKTNPLSRNSKVNYLTNCREIALLGVKGGKPTFNSKRDWGIYRFPIQGGKIRCHPTQKNLKLFEALIEKHSNKNDLVIDPFLGGGTTAIACKNTDRKFKGCEINKEYFDKIKNI